MSDLSESENLYYRLSHELLALQIEMKRLELWQAALPHPTVLASIEPFCVDTLTLPQWLQFVFVPRLTSLIEGGEPLPTAISAMNCLPAGPTKVSARDARSGNRRGATNST